MPSPKPYRYIRRIDRTDTHSWHVSIKRMNQTVTKHFSDRVYGSKEAALKAAMIFRDSILESLNTTEYALWKRKSPYRERNTSGIIGIGRYTNKYKKKDGSVSESASWQAFWQDQHGKRHIRTFSVKTHGEEQAKELAIQARAQAMFEMYGRAEITTEHEVKETEENTHHVRLAVKEQQAAPKTVTCRGGVERDAFLRYSKVTEKFIAYPYWRASWIDEKGNERSCRFTVHRYGEEQAFELAINALKAAMKALNKTPS